MIATASLSFFLVQEDVITAMGNQAGGVLLMILVTEQTVEKHEALLYLWVGKQVKKRFNSVKMFLFYLTISKFFLLLSLKEEKNPLNQKTKALALIS